MTTDSGNNIEQKEWNERNTEIFATGQSDGAVMLHAARIEKKKLVVSKLLSVHTSSWSGTMSAKQIGITNLCFHWNVWDRTNKTEISPLQRRPRKISMGTKGKGSIGKSAFMSKNVMKHKKKTGMLTTPVPPKQFKQQEETPPEPLLVVGTGGGSIFIISPKESSGIVSDRTVRWKSGIDVEYRHHSHGGVVECCEPLSDGRHVVSASRDGTLRVWSIDSNRDRRCRAMVGLPGLGVCVAPHISVDVLLDSQNTKFVYVGTSEGQVVKVDLHYVSKEEQKVKEAEEMRRRQRRQGKEGGRGGGGSSLRGNDLSWSLCVVDVVDVQNPNGQAMETIQCMSMRPTGGLIAAGSRDNNVYLIGTTTSNSNDNSIQGMVVLKMMTGSSSFVQTIDWSLDGTLLQTNDANREILYWKVPSNLLNVVKSKQVPAAKDIIRDVVWSRWTCLFGWGVSGIWAGTSDATDVNTACRGGKRGDLLVTGDDFRCVRLYTYPCLPGAQEIKYRGHHSHVMSVRFCQNVNNDWCLVSAGGLDRCIFLWKVIEDEGNN